MGYVRSLFSVAPLTPDFINSAIASSSSCAGESTLPIIIKSLLSKSLTVFVILLTKSLISLDP